MTLRERVARAICAEAYTTEDAPHVWPSFLPQADAAIAEGLGIGPRIEFHQQDWIPGFAAFIDDGKKLTRDPKSTAFCVLNLGSFLAAIQTGNLSHESLAREIADSMCHEVLHVIEKWCEVEFSEDRVNGLLDKYRDYVLADDAETQP